MKDKLDFLSELGNIAKLCHNSSVKMLHDAKLRDGTAPRLLSFNEAANIF